MVALLAHMIARPCFLWLPAVCVVGRLLHLIDLPEPSFSVRCTIRQELPPLTTTAVKFNAHGNPDDVLYVDEKHEMPDRLGHSEVRRYAVVAQAAGWRRRPWLHQRLLHHSRSIS